MSCKQQKKFGCSQIEKLPFWSFAVSRSGEDRVLQIRKSKSIFVLNSQILSLSYVKRLLVFKSVKRLKRYEVHSFMKQY